MNLTIALVFRQLNQLLSLLPLLVTVDAVFAHMTVILFDLSLRRRAHWAVRTGMTFHRDLTDTASVSLAWPFVWDLLAE